MKRQRGTRRSDTTPFTDDEALERVARKIIDLIVEADLNDGDILRVCVSVTAYLGAIAGVKGEFVGRKVQEAIEYHKHVLASATMPRA